MQRVAPAFGLFLLAPFVGEFLLGNLTVGELGLGILLAPLYGCGALLVREVARRTGRGWPTMMLLAAAYALIEEGPVDQLLWNDSYSNHDLLHDDSYIPALGMSVNLTLVIIAMHTVWSICVPIAIVETLTPDRRTTPWLRTPGLVVTAVLYLLGANFVFWGTYAEERFLASPAQFGTVGLVIAGLVVLAFRVGRRSRPPIGGQAPSPWLVGLATLVGTSLYLAPDWYEWLSVAIWCVLAVTSVVLVSRWSRQDGWGAPHVFALAAGATLTYAWTAFPARPESESSPTVDLIGNIVFALVALLILLLAARVVVRPLDASGAAAT